MILNKEIKPELLDKIKTVLSFENSRSNWKNKFESKEFKAASALGEIVGSPLNRSLNCGCIDDLFIVLKLIIKQHKLKPTEMNKEQSKFRIKNDGMIMVHGIAPITNANLTDEKAIELLKVNIKHISNFDIFPENWNDLIEDKVATKSKKVKTKEVVVEPTKEEVVDAEVSEEKVADVNKEQTREEELLGADKGVLKVLAESLFEAGKAPKKPHHKAGVDKLVAYILEYENK